MKKNLVGIYEYPSDCKISDRMAIYILMNKKTEREIREKLHAEEKKGTLNNRFGESYNKYAETAIIFFGTLGPMYILFYIAYILFMFPVGVVSSTSNSVSSHLPFLCFIPFIHAAIWIASIYSVYRKKSILYDL